MKTIIEPKDSAASPASVAIITRTKNRPQLLQRAVDSVLSQSFDDWVHVVVNDGGDPDPVLAVLEKKHRRYAGRLLYLSNAESAGMEAASNLGIRHSQSEFVLIHDDDDSLCPEFLQSSLLYLQEHAWPGLRGVVTHSTAIEEQLEGGAVVETRRYLHRDLAGCIDIASMAEVNLFPPIAFLYRREVFDEIGGYDEDLPVLGDWDFNLRFLARYEIGVLSQALANYHLRPANTATGEGNSLYADADRHYFYDGIVRNRFVRSDDRELARIGVLLSLARIRNDRAAELDRAQGELRRVNDDYLLCRGRLLANLINAFPYPRKMLRALRCSLNKDRRAHQSGD